MTSTRTRHPLPEPGWPTRAEAEASRLFSPITLASGCTAENRGWIPAMVPWRATEDGSVTDAVLRWYRRFAEGGPGVLVVEATGIRDVKSGPLLRIGHDRFIPGLRRLVDTVRTASGGRTRLLIQILDFLSIRRRPEPEAYFRRFLAVRDRHRTALADHFVDDAWRTASDDDVRTALASMPIETAATLLSERERDDLLRGARERVTDTHLPHIAELPKVLPGLFADAAARAREAGFDGVELHYAHAYTMASFLSPINTRDDGFGTTPEGRLRLPLEVLDAVRARTPAPFTVGIRFLADEFIRGGGGIDDGIRHALAFARGGADVLSLSVGGKFDDAAAPRVGEAIYPYTGPSGEACMPTVFGDVPPWSRHVPLAARIRSALRANGLHVPIVTAGAIGTFREAEAALATEAADFVGSARQSLADPDWWTKMRTGRGSDIRRCIYTNYCEALDRRHVEVTCQLWDRDTTAPDDGVRCADGRRRDIAPPFTV